MSSATESNNMPSDTESNNVPPATERLEAESQRFFEYYTHDRFHLRTALYTALVPNPQLLRDFVLGDGRKEMDRFKAYTSISLWSGIVKGVYDVGLVEQHELRTGRLMGQRIILAVPKAGIFWGVYGAVNTFMSSFREKDDAWNTFVASEAAITASLAITKDLLKLPVFTYFAVGFAFLKHNESYSDTMWGDSNAAFLPFRFWDSRHYEKGYTGKPFQGIPKDEN